MTTSRLPSRDFAAPLDGAVPGATIGRLVAAPLAGPPEVDVPGHGVRRARVLHSVDRAGLRSDGAVGREVLLVFVGGDPEQPVVVGLLEDPAEAVLAGTTDGGGARLDATVDGRAVVLDGTHEVTLRCGEASLTLHADGRIVTRGVNIVSQASEQQRIQGAVVKIN
jgi:hypothetical protein